MRSENKPVILGPAGETSGLPVYFIIVLVSLTCCFGTASAQRGNQSDWNVPPPLAPGTITKGDTEGRPGSSGVATLTFTDVAAAIQPVAGVPILELAPISTTPPDANNPGQPATDNVLAALPDIPTPEVPELPAMPERTLQDLPEPLATDIPIPDAPDMPPLPAEPAVPAAPNTRSTGLLPLMPELPVQPGSFSGPPAEAILWTIPAVPQTIDLN